MFKYCSFSEYSLSNILNNELYMNHYEYFNDPFECRCEILEGFPKKDINSPRFKNIVKAWGFDDASDQVALENYDDYISSLDGTEPIISHIIDSTRISCFSKKNNNILMWSHYADGLRGFCIEYDDDLILSNYPENTRIYEVLYKDTPATIDTAVIAVINDQINYHGDAIYALEQEMKYQGLDKKEEIQFLENHLKDVFTTNDYIFQSMLATKPIEWSYEEEIRIIFQTERYDKYGEFMSYPDKAIKSIIIGEKMPEKHRQTLEKILAQRTNPITLKFAKRKKGQFNILIDKKI